MAIISNRLNDYSNDKHIISDCQAGFRKGVSTSDNIFIINALIDILKSRNKIFFVCLLISNGPSTLFGGVDCGTNYKHILVILMENV